MLMYSPHNTLIHIPPNLMDNGIDSHHKGLHTYRRFDMDYFDTHSPEASDSSS